MISVRSMKLSKKLPLFIISFSILMGTILIGVTLYNFQKYAYTTIEKQMASLVADRRSAIKQLMTTVKADLQTMGASPATTEAMEAFSKSWAALGPQAGNILTKAYVTDNPNATGSKHLLDRASGDEVYHYDHEHYHNGFRTLIETKGYYDAFLINPEGDIVYSVFKETDYTSNLMNGPYKDSTLGELFRETNRSTAGSYHFVDLEPYAPSNGAAAGFIATPLYGPTNEFLGVLALQIPVAILSAMSNNIDGLGETTEIFIVGDDNLARTESRFEGGHEVLQELSARDHITAALDGKSHFYEAAIGLNGHEVVSYTNPVGLDYANWAMIVEQDVDELMAPVNKKRNLLIVITLVVTAILSVLGALFARSITKPIVRICANMADVSAGQLDADVPDAKRGDEVGEIGKTLVAMQEKLRTARSAEEARADQQKQQQHVVETLSAGLVRLSQGDFSSDIREAFGSDHEALRADFNKTVSTLNDTVSKVVDAADSIRNGASEISQSSDDLSHRTESQAATLEETAAALEELTASVKSAAEGARSVEGIMAEAKQEAEASGEVVQSAVSAMTEIEQSSSHIGQIIGVIDDIAFQTNLLALNAGVEAARAGEAGRGFAVVASEVRALAQRSSDAAMEIKTLIGDSSKQVERGVDLVGKAGDALQSITERVGHISKLVSDIAEGAVEQSTGLNEINTGVTQLDQVTQQNAAMVEEATAAGHLLNTDAGELTNLVSQFKVAGKAHRPTAPAAATPMAAPAASAAPSAHGEADWDLDEMPASQASVQMDGNAAKDMWQDF
ncbi:methyl-accepting chemotaxis protein [Pseudophaeobacter sp.]|uniref:methyl-accepting chemotaxis protein n=1 Tax=Pseudophaeobacter sp. TaxID=1971739 RepID=UPI0032988558